MEVHIGSLGGWGRTRPPPPRPLGCVCLFSCVQVLYFMQYKRLRENNRKKKKTKQKKGKIKGNSYSESSTPLTSPPTGDANSYKLITYKTLQYIHYVINTLL